MDQTEKKKKDRKNKTTQDKKGLLKTTTKVVSDKNEDLVEVVSELKNDLLNKERDHEEMVEEFAKLKARHEKLQ